LHSQKFRNAPYNHPMRDLIFGHQFANESLAKRPPLFYNTGDIPHHKPPLLHTSKIIARDFSSVRKSKLALSARPLASAAPTANRPRSAMSGHSITTRPPRRRGAS
jgi:hypothetical protein